VFGFQFVVASRKADRSTRTRRAWSPPSADTKSGERRKSGEDKLKTSPKSDFESGP